MTDPLPDFEAEVRFLTVEEGGRKELPMQGYKADIQYDDDPPGPIVWMIWPRFVNDGGKEISNGTIVPQIGHANFHVVNNELKNSVHRQRIKEGVKFHICEGQRRVATCRVTKILNLHMDRA